MKLYRIVPAFCLLTVGIFAIGCPSPPPPPESAAVPDDRTGWYNTTPRDRQQVERFFASPAGQAWDSLAAPAAQLLPYAAPGSHALVLATLASLPDRVNVVSVVVQILQDLERKPRLELPYLLAVVQDIPEHLRTPAMTHAVRLVRELNNSSARPRMVQLLPTLAFMGDLRSAEDMILLKSFIQATVLKASGAPEKRFPAEAVMAALSAFEAPLRPRIAMQAQKIFDHQLQGYPLHANKEVYKGDTPLDQIVAVGHWVESGNHEHALRFLRDLRAANCEVVTYAESHGGAKPFTELLKALKNVPPADYAELLAAALLLKSNDPLVNACVINLLLVLPADRRLEVARSPRPAPQF